MKLTPYQRAERAMKRQARQHYYVGKRKESIRKAIKLNTVNVIEITTDTSDMDVQSVRSFSDDVEGNRRAEKLFLRCVEENAALGKAKIKADGADLLDDGYFVEGTYRVLLTHSE